VTVHFIGAGPGAPDLITLRGRDLIAACPVCLYAGSLVPRALLDYCPSGARIVDTAPMSLDEIVAEFQRATDQGQDVARLHSGDLSIWSALGEQLRRLDALDIAFTVTPGVPAFAAAAAALAKELTLPEVAQSVAHVRPRLVDARNRKPVGLRGDPRDAGDSSLHSLARQDRRRTCSRLWRGLPGGGGVPRQLAR